MLPKSVVGYFSLLNIKLIHVYAFKMLVLNRDLKLHDGISNSMNLIVYE